MFMENSKALNQNTSNKKSSKPRVIVAGILSLIAALILVPMVLSIWVNVILLNPDNFANSATNILVNPKVSSKIASSLSDTIITNDTIGDLTQSVLTPEEASKVQEVVKTRLKEIFNQNIVDIINRPAFKQNATALFKTVHVQLIEKPTPGASTSTINLRPIITSIIDSTKGTRIAIVSSKFNLESGKGIFVLNQSQYKSFKNILSFVKTGTAAIIGSFVVILGLAVLAANNRQRITKRLLLVFGIILVVVGLPLLIAPFVLSSSTSDSVAAVSSGASVLTFPLSLTMLIIGVLFIAGGVFMNSKMKKSSKALKTK